MKRFFKKHLIPIIMVVILCVIFTSFTGSSDTLAWWIIGIVGCILIGIAIVKLKGTPSLSGISLPSIKIWKNIGVVAAVIVVGVIGWRWYLNHPNHSVESTETVTTSIDPYAGYTVITYGNAQPLKAGVKYRYDREDGQHVFTAYRKDTHVSPPQNIDERWHYITVDKNDLVWVTQEVLP